MNLSRPWAIVRSALDMEILRVLLGTKRPLTGREVARLVRAGSQSAVNMTLRRLSVEGVLLSQEAGKAYLYTVNREHLATPGLEQLASIRSELERRLRDEVGAWKVPAAHISMFGSAARGDGDEHSDVDVFVVRRAGVPADDPRWRAQLVQLAEHVQAWTGNHVGLSEVSAVDAQRLRKQQPPVADALRQDAITIFGPTASELLRASA